MLLHFWGLVSLAIILWNCGTDYPGNTSKWSHSFPCFHVHCIFSFPICDDMWLYILKYSWMFLRVQGNKLKNVIKKVLLRIIPVLKSSLAPDMTWVIFVFPSGRETLDWSDSFLQPLLLRRRVAYNLQIYKIAKYSLE